MNGINDDEVTRAKNLESLKRSCARFPMDFYLSMSGVLDDELERDKSTAKGEAPVSYRVSGLNAERRFANAYVAAMAEAEKFFADYVTKGKSEILFKPIWPWSTGIIASSYRFGIHQIVVSTKSWNPSNPLNPSIR